MQPFPIEQYQDKSLVSTEKENGVEISIVSPVFNEEGGLNAFVDTITAILDKISDSWEIIFADDGSTDKSPEILQTLRIQDKRIKFLRFSRNFGNQAAISAGLKYSRGKCVVIIDSDLQYPPELIPEMFRLWKYKGYHSVYTIRTYGKETGKIKKFVSSLFAKTLNYCSRLSSPEGSSDFRLLDRKIVDYVNQMGENSRFLRAMISWLGFRQIGVPFRMRPRFAGTTKFSFFKLLGLALDAIASFSVTPLRWITYCGLIVAASALFYAVAIFFYEVFTTGIVTSSWTVLLVAVLFLGGMQLTALGVIGEYVGRIYIETKRRPLFVIQETRGFESQREYDLSKQEKAA
ncbi:MAG: glycosyltransferase family 2 protein [Planctomycetaceae bacterium]|jgi:dolichol-phosphate mannosyltransferase|nr:glycosyltransferase family 2 protein [Planctomycetaceae bacterium]